MTVTAHHIPQHQNPVGPDALERGRDARREAEAARRRQEALARLVQRRMPLPGRPLPDRPRPGDGTVGPSAGRHRAHMTLVTSSVRAETGTGRCGCSTQATPDLDRPSLTTREVEVLRTWLMVDSKPAVAEELFISLGTVNTHLTRIRAKYSDVGRAAPTKAALVARAVQDGLIALEEL